MREETSKQRKKKTRWQTIKQEISWQWTLIKARAIIKYYDRRDKKLARKHCKKGFHKFVPDGLRVERSTKSGGSKLVINAKFHECQVCNIKMFHTAREAQKYCDYLKKEANKTFDLTFTKKLKNLRSSTGNQKQGVRFHSTKKGSTRRKTPRY
ncbi:hypothetical protein K9M79_02995 [Candidatus Woesearchaeota archaeon]|nr:hypothetical protein [Candidatus Woesearchaeota archaeon]